MRKNTPILIAMLTIAFLMSMPTFAPARVHAINQSQVTSWSPFGPATPNIVIHDYSDFITMFTAFKAGQIDVSDWPVQTSDLNTLCANADVWCSTGQPEFGIFQLDFNNHAPFLGTPLQTARPSLVGSVANVVSGSSAACANGQGQLTLNIVNVEAGNAVYKDSSNTVIIANQPSGTPASLPTNDQGGSTPTGTYVFPCILAGTYLITGSIVTGNATSGTHLACGSAGGCTIAIPAGTAPNGGTVSATWNVVWNSPSTLTPTAAMPNILKAIAHLVDKPELVQHDPIIGGHARCDDVFLAPAHLIQGSPCVTPPAGEPGTPFPASVLTRECSNLVLDAVITACAPISAYHLVDSNHGASDVWWGIPGRSARGGVATGYPSAADIDAACQYLRLAGFTLTGGTANTCAELAQLTLPCTQPCTPVQPAAYPHFTAPVGTHFVALLRTDPPRAHFGQIVSDFINMAFGTPNDSGSCPLPCTQTSTGTATVLYYNSGGALQPTATYNRIAVAVPLIFGDGAQPDRWNIYTGGFSLGSTPDFLFSNYHSQFASTACGGAFNLFPADYDFHCDPGYDAITNAGEFQAVAAPTLTGAAAVFQDAAVRAYDVPVGVPQYSRIQIFAENNGWNWQTTGNGLSSSLVVQKGHGTQVGFYSLLNMRQVPGYVPASSVFTPGGGNPNLIRRGFSQDPDTVNVYQATTVWDFEIISQVYDSMLVVNPETGGANQQVVDWMTTSHSSFFNPVELGCITGPSVVATTCVHGITTQTWHLRSDLFFHDGTPVTAQDVVYSILTQRDVPSANGFPSVAFVTNAVALDAKTVQVKLELNSAFYELNIGGVPIVPQHLYQGPGGSVCGSISTASTPAGPVQVVANGPSSACADINFDPVTCVGSAGTVAGCGTTFPDGSHLGIFVGSAGYECNYVGNAGAAPVQASGKAGGSCFQSSTGALIGGTSFATDARALLTAFPNYMRGPRGAQGTALQKAAWGDVNKDGIVNILDGSNMAFFFDKANPYWVHPQFSCSTTASVVDVCVASALAILFDTGNTAPFGGQGSAPALLNIDPQIDPYSAQLTGTNTCLYFQHTSATTSATTAGLALVGCGSSGGASLPAGHTITATGSHMNPDGSETAPQSGTVTPSGSSVTVTFAPAISPSAVIRIYDNGALVLTIRVG